MPATGDDVTSLVLIGSVTLTPNGPTCCVELWLAYFDCDRQSVHIQLPSPECLSLAPSQNGEIFHMDCQVTNLYLFSIIIMLQ